MTFWLNLQPENCLAVHDDGVHQVVIVMVQGIAGSRRHYGVSAEVQTVGIKIQNLTDRHQVALGLDIR